MAEVKKVIFLNAEEVSDEFERLGVKADFVDKKISEILVSKIMNENRLHDADATHAAAAIENKADFIVTWNIKGFEKAKHLIKCASPIGILEIPWPIYPFVPAKDNL
ncbi:MAG: hypothetical protein PHH08_00670 [Candidatus ainarchaeum sp.]|nr:hypothetical protein [Candidatus ainarchaeum sp.]